jgi:flagellar biosynthesis protein FliQ
MPFYIQLLHYALTVELNAVLPIIALLLVVGLLTAILQASLQIEDAGFSLLPKVIIMIALPLLGGTAAMHGIATLATYWISHAGQLVQRSWS